MARCLAICVWPVKASETMSMKKSVCACMTSPSANSSSEVYVHPHSSRVSPLPPP